MRDPQAVLVLERVLVRHATILAQPPGGGEGCAGAGQGCAEAGQDCAGAGQDCAGASVDSRWLNPCGARARLRAEVTTLTAVVRRILPPAALSALTSP